MTDRRDFLKVLGLAGTVAAAPSLADHLPKVPAAVMEADDILWTPDPVEIKDDELVILDWRVERYHNDRIDALGELLHGYVQGSGWMKVWAHDPRVWNRLMGDRKPLKVALPMADGMCVCGEVTPTQISFGVESGQHDASADVDFWYKKMELVQI